MEALNKIYDVHIEKAINNTYGLGLDPENVFTMIQLIKDIKEAEIIESLKHKDLYIRLNALYNKITK